MPRTLSRKRRPCFRYRYSKTSQSDPVRRRVTGGQGRRQLAMVVHLAVGDQHQDAVVADQRLAAALRVR